MIRMLSKSNRSMMHLTILAYMLAVLLPCLEGYKMVLVDPGKVTKQPGEKVSLKCRTDDHWEWCKFISPQGTYCEFEWKFLKQNVTLQSCNGFDGRVQFYGSYDDLECGITISSLKPEDSGEWKCHMEEYVTLGYHGSGATVESEIQVKVEKIAPPSTYPTSTPTSTTATTSTQQQEAEVMEVEGSGDLTKMVGSDQVPVPVPRVNLEQADPKADSGSSSPVAIVVGLVCGVVILCLVALAVFMRSRYRNNDAAAAVVYQQEAKSVHDKRTIIPKGLRGLTSVIHLGASNNSISSNSTSGTDNPNYHEFVPPNLNRQRRPSESSA